MQVLPAFFRDLFSVEITEGEHERIDNARCDPPGVEVSAESTRLRTVAPKHRNLRARPERDVNPEAASRGDFDAWHLGLQRVLPTL